MLKLSHYYWFCPGCAGSRVANQGGTDNPSAAGGMIPELFLPAESDATIGGLVNYNPYAPKQQTKTLALRAADGPEQP